MIQKIIAQKQQLVISSWSLAKARKDGFLLTLTVKVGFDFLNIFLCVSESPW